MKKTFISIFLIVSMLLCLCSCNLFHKHSWQSYLVKEPTCTEKGVLKELCLECGDVSYEEINMLEHNYSNGICTVCGALGSNKKDLTRVPIPDNSDNQGKWSTEKIYVMACHAGYTGTYSSYIASFNNISIKNARFDAFGMIEFTLTYIYQDKTFDIPLLYTIDKVSPENPGASVGVFLRADINESKLYFTYTTGTQAYVGNFNDIQGNSISGFGINNNNELIVYYENDTIAFAGKIMS